MKKKALSVLLTSITTSVLMAGCGVLEAKPVATPVVEETVVEETVSEEAVPEEDNEEETEETQEDVVEVTDEEVNNTVSVLEDGVYQAKFDTDSGMFHVNEACNGLGELTVKDGQMTIHISLVSKKIKNLYLGLAEDAQKEGAELLEPTVDTVVYEDGMSDEVFGFDVPVPVLGEEFDLALIGEKGVWYDHKVSVSEPVAVTDEAEAETTEEKTEEVETEILASEVSEGTYSIDVTLEGGSGKSTVESPCTLTVKDGVYYATITWSSPNYDFMIVNDEEYRPTNTEGNSVFEIPVSALDTPVAVQADTVAMSKPHLIDYTLTFDSASMQVK